jgi:hypothetical protein
MLTGFASRLTDLENYETVDGKSNSTIRYTPTNMV